MTNRIYPPDQIDPNSLEEDDGTMPENVAKLEEALIGRKIVKAEQWSGTYNNGYFDNWGSGLILTLDSGEKWIIADTYDCCAYTELERFLLHPESIDHAITSVETRDGYTKWFILADMAHVLDLEVSWSCGNPFYYGYGFDIEVVKEEA